MKKLDFMNAITRKVNRAGFQLKKYSPELLVGAGIVGVIGSTIMACKATTKIDEVLAETKENLEKTHSYVKENGYSEKYTEEDHKKDTTIFYAKGGIELVKLYAPSVALGALSITAILSGHHILRKRNIALAAAYKVLDKSFKDYRGRVVERFGEELDKELKYNIKSKEIEEKVINEDGKETTVKKNIDVVNPDEISEYARFFEDGCKGWTKDPEFNLMFLRDQQKFANHILKTKGHLFLNEVYDLLGIPRSQAGQIVGWIYDEKHPNGDNTVDFGIYDLHDERKRAFVNGYERTILLDFNVDGPIIELM